MTEQKAEPNGRDHLLDQYLRNWHMFYVLDDAGEPVVELDVLKWARWYENKENRHVALTVIAGCGEVSTVFLGLDHSWMPGGMPVLWETMVFGGPLDMEQCRYRSKAEALAGHEDMVKRVQEALGNHQPQGEGQ